MAFLESLKYIDLLFSGELINHRSRKNINPHTEAGLICNYMRNIVILLCNLISNCKYRTNQNPSRDSNKYYYHQAILYTYGIHWEPLRNYSD